MSPVILIGLALAGFGLWLLARSAAEGRVRARDRAGYLDGVKPLFDDVEVRIQPTGFPRMSGRLDGLSFDLQVVPDTLTFRKLPALWVLVSLPEPLPLKATLDVMARPSGNEPFSHFVTLSQSLPTPPGLPCDVSVRSDDAARCPPAELIARHAEQFNDPQVKELVLSPRGLRIVILAEEADRGRFLLLREADMGRTPLAPARLLPVLDRLRVIREDILTLQKETT